MRQIDQIYDHDVDGVKSVTIVVGGTSVTQSYGRSVFDDDRNSAIDKAYARANEIESNK